MHGGTRGHHLLDHRWLPCRRHLRALVGGRSARGCLPNIIVGVVGGLLGRWLAEQVNVGAGTGFIATLVVAIIGAVIIRFILESLNRRT